MSESNTTLEQCCLDNAVHLQKTMAINACVFMEHQSQIVTATTLQIVKFLYSCETVDDFVEMRRKLREMLEGDDE